MPRAEGERRRGARPRAHAPFSRSSRLLAATRGGVPVFIRPSRRPQRARAPPRAAGPAARPSAPPRASRRRRGSGRAGTSRVVTTAAPHATSPPSSRTEPGEAPVRGRGNPAAVPRRRSGPGAPRGRARHLCSDKATLSDWHRRPADRRAAGGVQDLELDSGPVRDEPHRARRARRSRGRPVPSRARRSPGCSSSARAPRGRPSGGACRGPRRAAASAASQPACPPPTTTTSNRSRTSAPRPARGLASFSDTERREDPVEELLGRRLARDLAERVQRVAQRRRDELVGGPRRRAGASERGRRPRERLAVPVEDEEPLAGSATESRARRGRAAAPRVPRRSVPRRRRRRAASPAAARQVGLRPDDERALPPSASRAAASAALSRLRAVEDEEDDVGLRRRPAAPPRRRAARASSVVSRSPAVSTRRTRAPRTRRSPRRRRASSPARPSRCARSSPRSALKSVDFPAFGASRDRRPSESARAAPSRAPPRPSSVESRRLARERRYERGAAPAPPTSSAKSSHASSSARSAEELLAQRRRPGARALRSTRPSARRAAPRLAARDEERDPLGPRQVDLAVRQARGA